MSQRFPVSVKGVVVRDGRVLLLRNERDEWELPGGKLDRSEDPQACVVREIAEEVGWTVECGSILDSWLYRIHGGVEVLIVTYGCHPLSGADPVLSDEHKAIGLFAEAEIRGLPMPDGYRRSIVDWYARLARGPDGR